MFSKLANRVLLGAARILDSWARFIIARVAEEDRRNSIEAADDSLAETEDDSPVELSRHGAKRVSSDEPQNSAVENRRLQVEPGDSRPTARREISAAVDARASRPRRDEYSSPLAATHRAIADSRNSVARAKSRRGAGGLPTEARDGVPPGAGTCNGIAPEAGIDERVASEQVDFSRVIDVNWEPVAVVASHRAESAEDRQSPVERETVKRENTVSDALSEPLRQPVATETDEMRDATTPKIDRDSDALQAERADSPTAPAIAIDAIEERSNDAPWPARGVPCVAAEAEWPGSNPDDPSGGAARKTGRTDAPETRTITINAPGETVQPAPAAAAPRWPKLRGENRRHGDSRSGPVAHPWPELPDEMASAEAGIPPTERRAAAELVGDIDRIRYLDREQRGLLWNA